MTSPLSTPLLFKVIIKTSTCFSHSSLDSSGSTSSQSLTGQHQGVPNPSVDSCASPPLTMLRPSWYCWIPLFSWWSHFTEKNWWCGGSVEDLYWYLLHFFWRQQTMHGNSTMASLKECFLWDFQALNLGRLWIYIADPSGSCWVTHLWMDGGWCFGKSHGFNNLMTLVYYTIVGSVGILIYSKMFLLLE